MEPINKSNILQIKDIVGLAEALQDLQNKIILNNDDKHKYLEDEIYKNTNQITDELRCLKHEVKKLKEYQYYKIQSETTTDNSMIESISDLIESLTEYKDELSKVKESLEDIKNQTQSSDNSTKQNNQISSELQNIKLELNKLKKQTKTGKDEYSDEFYENEQLNEYYKQMRCFKYELKKLKYKEPTVETDNSIIETIDELKETDDSILDSIDELKETLDEYKNELSKVKKYLKNIEYQIQYSDSYYEDEPSDKRNKHSKNSSESQIQENKIENLVDNVFNQPIFIDEDTQDYPPEEVFITPEIYEEAVQKKPYADFIPTISLHLDKSPKEINYDELNNFLGENTVILDVERFPSIEDSVLNEVEHFSTILQIANLSVEESEGDIQKKLEEYIEQLKDKLKERFNSVVGNFVEEPEIRIPDDDDIKNVYCRPSINNFSHPIDLNKEEISTIKQLVLQKLHEDKDMYNWQFIFKYEDLYNKMEEKIREDLIINPFEMIVVNKTMFANKYIEEYEKIKKQIPQDDIVECFLYHGTNLCNHQKILNEHFYMQGENKNIKTTDLGYYGKGIYATENPYYAAMYRNNECKRLNNDEKASIICCITIYNKSKVNNLENLNFGGNQIDDNIKNNYGINHAFVGDKEGFRPIKEKDKDKNEITAHEFVFPNKFQIIPLCSLTIMRKDHYIIWKDTNIRNNENFNLLKQLSKKLEVNVYTKNNNKDALKIIGYKKYARVKLITNGGSGDSKGEDFIKQARSIINSKFVSLVFARDINHLKWITKMDNVLFTLESKDFMGFAELKLDLDNVIAFAEKMKEKYKNAFKKCIRINKDELLNFPKFDKENNDSKNYCNLI